MLIGGLQKLSLLDYPDRTCCTVFAAGCNFRCPWCHNAALVRPGGATLPVAEVMAFLEKRQGLLDGVCLSGGEPLLQAGAGDFLRGVKALGYAVKVDTNGSVPARLKQLVGEGLVDYVAMDIKNSRACYGETTGLDGCDTAPVEESAAFLLAGTVDYELRTTLVRGLHTTQSVEALARWIAGAKRYYLQAFEDSGNLLAPDQSGFTAGEMEAFLQVVRPHVPTAELRGYG